MSDPGPAGALVCGFSDLAAGLGGLAWDLGDRGGLMLSNDEVTEATVEISDQEGAVRVEMKAGDSEVEATLAPRVDPVPLIVVDGSPPPGGPVEAAICTATVKPAGQRRTLQCFGHLSRWSGSPIEGAGTFRHLAIEAFEGSLLLVAAGGAAGADHGDEEVAAWLLDREGGGMTFGEALLSTQYDQDGRQTRVGLELWPEGEEQTMRAAATRPAGTRLGGTDAAGSGIAAALFRCSTEGAEGLGSYLIWRA